MTLTRFTSTLVGICAIHIFIVESVRFTNINCTSLDPEFSSFSVCSLKMIRRNTVGLNITCNLHKIPVTNVSINVSIFKRSNGYHPYMLNISTDFCKFAKNRNKQPLFKILADFLLRNSNINHECPFDHDLVARNLVLDQKLFSYIPLQTGDYMFRLIVAAYNDWKADVKVFFKGIIKNNPKIRYRRYKRYIDVINTLTKIITDRIRLALTYDRHFDFKGFRQ
ncbi:uncharacterized protein LOC142224495 [Haematobia irritans]|uniref:uncharacterized protein LOC142224495 n=1 Tax=Haematobia irritans TaxID=7368 RepID=UPI003F4FFD42